MGKKRFKDVCYVLLGGLVLGMFFTTGCQNDNMTDSEINGIEINNEDVALSVAGLICENSGGVLNQVGDILMFTADQGIEMLSKTEDAQRRCSHSAIYDSLTQTWTIHISREKGTPADSIYSKFERTYTIQFLNKNGLPQKRWFTRGDTAYSIDFDIVDGSGCQIKPRFSHHLKYVGGGWYGTGANTDMLTINGTYHRAAIDTIFRDNVIHISDHAVDLSLNNVTGPRGSGRDLSQKVSGTITGVYTATVTLVREGFTEVREIERDIYIQLGNGEIVIRINQEYHIADPITGDLKDT